MPDASAPPQRALRATPFVVLFLAALAFFLVSGACGLLYQVVWTRKLVLLFGTTSYAVSTVLSIFFLGLGLGSLWGGRLADRCRNPLRWYGFFEIVIGLWALLFILVVQHGEGVVVALLRAVEGGRGLGIALRAAMTAALLLVPVTLMGATLPLVAKYVNHEAKVRGFRVGALYTFNTLGAVCGCLLAGFYLLPALGYTTTTLIGAAANVLVGIVALMLARGPVPASVPEPEAQPTETIHAPRAVAVMAAFAVAGFCGLALEVLWTRLLAIVFLGTTYAYATMLGTLLFGIALGSGVASLVADRSRAHRAALGAAMALTAVGALFSLRVIAGMPEALQEVFRDTGGDWEKLTLGKFWLGFRALILPTFFMGVTFPFAVRALGSVRAQLGRDVGRLYAANTFGGVLGALAGGFLIIPVLGTHGGIVALAGLLGAVGASLLLVDSQLRPVLRAVGVIALAALFGTAWQSAPDDVNAALNQGYVWAEHEVIAYSEGVEATVTVTQHQDAREGEDRVLMINGVQATASIEKGVKMNRLQGVLPLLFDRDPETVLFMCFGSGITAGTLALSDFARIDAVEISRDVLDAAPFFEADNLGVMERAQMRFHIDDGRNFLLTTQNRYDVITFEPMPLALAGVSTFYTREYYESCLARLNPGGLVSQWVPLHSLNPEIVRSLVHTFTSVFPHCSAWFINADLFLMGSDAPMRIDPARLARHLENPVLRDALAEVGFHDMAEIVACFLMDQDGLDAYAAGGRIMTDDRPWAEFVAPKTVHQRTVQDTLAEIQPHVAASLSILDEVGVDSALLARLERRHRARIQDIEGVRRYYGGLLIDPAIAGAFKASLAIDPENFNAKFYLRQIVEAVSLRRLDWEEYEEAEAMLLEALDYVPEAAELHLVLADVYAAWEKPAEAREAYARYGALGGTAARDFAE